MRLNRRFESVDNDRQEDVVDLLNHIASKAKDSQTLMSRVVAQLDSEGTICGLLKQICDAFRASMISESPQMEVVATNTADIRDCAAQQLALTQRLSTDWNAYRTQHLSLLEAILDKESTARQTATEALTSIKLETEALTRAVEQLDGNSHTIGADLKHELIEMKDEMSSIRAEMRLTRDAIIDILPEKLMQIFIQMQSTSGSHHSDGSSQLGSDVELIDSESVEQLVRSGSEKNQLLSESSGSESSGDDE